MSITRLCDACNQPIKKAQHLELTARVVRTFDGETRDSSEQNYKDYCDGCIANGTALGDLLTGLRYKVRKGK